MTTETTLTYAELVAKVSRLERELLRNAPAVEELKERTRQLLDVEQDLEKALQEVARLQTQREVSRRRESDKEWT